MNHSGSASSSRRKTSWKRRVRLMQKEEAPKEEQESRKRKGDAIEGNENKRVRDDESMEIKMNSNLQILTEAVE